MFGIIIINLIVIGSISVLTSGSMYGRKKKENQEYSREMEYEKIGDLEVIPALINESSDETSEIKCIICFQNDCPTCGLKISEDTLDEIKSSITNLLNETEMTTPELRAYFKLNSSKIWKLMRELEKAQKIRRSGKKGRAILWSSEICGIKCPHCDQIYHKHCWEKTIRTISVCSFCLRNPSS